MATAQSWDHAPRHRAERPRRPLRPSWTLARALAALSLVATSAVATQQHPFLADSIESASAAIPQAPALANSSEPAHTAVQQQLYGRFLHITDMHPDSFYKYKAAVSSSCHSNKPHKKKPDGKARAGFWGTPRSDCDSPPRLVEATLAWLSANWRSPDNEDGIDYVIWTGDSARHDIDSGHPRTRAEIYEYNRWALAQLESAFPGVPIVPTIGNNDIFPHNIMFPGPNDITREFTSIWASQVPESEFHVFQRGGYFAKEVLPNELAVLSLNTLYFYDSNKAVDGCKAGSGGSDGKDSDPGTDQLDWLEVQLSQFRARGLQVQLIGHVPPTAGNYFPRCYEEYTDIVLRYQDTIVGQHFGHMNVDAIFVQEGPGGTLKEGASDGIDADSEPALAAQSVHAAAGTGIVDDIRAEFDTLPGRRRTNLDRYNFFFSAPSVVPTWWPSVRVWTYNTTRESAFRQRDASTSVQDDGSIEHAAALDGEEDADNDEVSVERNHRRPKPPRKRKKKHNKKKAVYHSDADAPARTNRFLTQLGYSQWVLDLDAANAAYKRWDKEHGKRGKGHKGKKGKKHHGGGRWPSFRRSAFFHRAKPGRGSSDASTSASGPEAKAPPAPAPAYQLEYATYTPEVLWSDFAPPGSSKRKHGAARAPVPKHLLEAELRRFGLDAGGGSALSAALSGDASAGGDGDDSGRGVDAKTLKKKEKLPKALRHMTDWRVEALTIGEVMDFARRLANDEKLWKRYVRRIFSSSGAQP